MGYRKKDDGVVYTEDLIQRCLRSGFLSPNSKKYEMFNLFVYGWESDYLAITKSDYVYEVEIKISRSDFFNDFKHKEQKHLIMEGKEGIIFPDNIEGNRPNYFYYAVPENLISIEEVPEYAGLIYITPYHWCNIVKTAPKLIKEPSNLESLNLTNKFYYAYQTWRDKCIGNDISELKSQIKSLEKQIMEYDDMLSERQNEIDELMLKLKEKD